MVSAAGDHIFLKGVVDFSDIRRICTANVRSNSNPIGNASRLELCGKI
jgi:hypothetical protein